MTATNANNENTEARPNCCEVEGERCTCLPYNDYLIILASCFAFVAFALSWLWYVCFIVAIPGMIAFQTLWCCRQSALQLYVFATIAGICSLINIGVGIYWNTSFGTYTWCAPWILEGDGNNNNNINDYEPSTNSNGNSKFAGDDILSDDVYLNIDDFFADDELDWFTDNLRDLDICFEGVFATLSYACGLLWGLTCIFTVCFVQSGRHAKRETGFHSAVANRVQEVELPPTAVEYEEESTNFAIPIVVPTAVLEAESTTPTTPTTTAQADTNSITTSNNHGR